VQWVPARGGPEQEQRVDVCHRLAQIHRQVLRRTPAQTVENLGRHRRGHHAHGHDRAKAVPARKNGIGTRESDVTTGVFRGQPDAAQQCTKIRIYIR
jgi:hypothetical protein